MRGVAIAAAVLSAGCVEHRAVAGIPAPPADALLADAQVAGRTASAPATITTRSALPIAVDVDVVERDGDGRIRRATVRLTTPTPWWQRFPVDLFTDLTPWAQPVSATATLVALPVEPTALDDLTAAARSAGYARP